METFLLFLNLVCYTDNIFSVPTQFKQTVATLTPTVASSQLVHRNRENVNFPLTPFYLQKAIITAYILSGSLSELDIHRVTPQLFRLQLIFHHNYRHAVQPCYNWFTDTVTICWIIWGISDVIFTDRKRIT